MKQWVRGYKYSLQTFTFSQAYRRPQRLLEDLIHTFRYYFNIAYIILGWQNRKLLFKQNTLTNVNTFVSVFVETRLHTNEKCGGKTNVNSFFRRLRKKLWIWNYKYVEKELNGSDYIRCKANKKRVTGKQFTFFFFIFN